jgi:hypothetical protein
MLNYSKASKRTIVDKPTCAICFAAAGTGKTITVMEASSLTESVYCRISLLNNALFRHLLNTCKNMGEEETPPLAPEDRISFDKVEPYFEQRFQIFLAQLCESIMEQLTNLDPQVRLIDVPDHLSPEITLDKVESVLPTYRRLTSMSWSFMSMTAKSSFVD